MAYSDSFFVAQSLASKVCLDLECIFKIRSRNYVCATLLQFGIFVNKSIPFVHFTQYKFDIYLIDLIDKLEKFRVVEPKYSRSLF